jgi:hypothetical protein
MGDLNPVIAENEVSRPTGLHRKTGYFSFMFSAGIVCSHVCGCSLILQLWLHR